MPLTRQQKENTVAKTQEDITGAVSSVFVSFDGLSLADINELRNNLYDAGCRLRVIPKRLLKLVLQNAKLEFDPVSHEGQMAVVWGPDAVAPAKILQTFAKTHDTIQLRAGVLEGEVIALEQVLALAKLPSREELLGQLVGTIAGPMRGFVTVLSGVQRNMVYVLSAIKDKKSQS